MCGIVFALRQSTRNNPNPQILAALLIANESRGRQATGIWGNGMYKDTKPATAMFGKLDTQAGLSKFKLLAKIAKHPVFIGHTRQGTTGGNTKANAHPFRYKNTVGCHNGVLSNYKEIAEKYNLPKPEVDSQVIFSALVEGDYDMARVSEIHGSIAFVMNREEARKKMMYADGRMQEVDVPSNITYIYRRDNPLFVAKHAGILYGSSLSEPLKALGLTPVSLEENTLYIYVDGRLMEKRFIEYARPSGYSGVNNFGWTKFEDDDFEYPSRSTRFPVTTTKSTYNKEDFTEAVNILITQALLAINEVSLNLPYQLGYDDEDTTGMRYCLIDAVTDKVMYRSDSPIMLLKEFMVKACSCTAPSVAEEYTEAIKWLVTYCILQLNGADTSYPTTVAGKDVWDAINVPPIKFSLIDSAINEFPVGTDFSVAIKHATKFGFYTLSSSLKALEAEVQGR
jgi:hypothetical protein